MKPELRIDPSRIAFDFDGVIADTFRLFVNLARQNYGVEIDYEAIGDYEFTEALDLPAEQTQDLIDDLTYRSHELGLEPIGDALKTLARLSTLTSPLIVTARPVGEPVAIWLNEQLPGADFRIAATGSPEAKLGVLKDSGIGFFIDDRLDTCEMLHHHGLTPLVFAQPWNRVRAHGFRTVSTWREIDELIDW
ncbi:MAG: 5' nucleotidase, deoxy (Pyrimidine), cytosolic type C protein (NT5C) [Deltaproteobacteria bacterium ADurb.Bin510]|nr:MAG: 5' nucleotidase, deoxy (Pyrimidine), cytosolic type C protein (NT5C) [Deltaproteobacteria bacterium ADurb.Bin510]